MYKPYPDHLAHYGVLGMHWGIRRYQPYTNGQKGTFLNLRKKYKGEVKSLKRESRKSNDPLIKDANKQRIKDAKAKYKADLKDLKSKYDLDNYEAYKQKVVESGSEKEIRKLRRELTPAQLQYATDRIRAQKAFSTASEAATIKAENDKLKAQVDRINLKKQLEQAKAFNPKAEKRARDKAEAKKEKQARKAAKAALKKAKIEGSKKDNKDLLQSLAGAAITGSTLRDLVVMARNRTVFDPITKYGSGDFYSALTALKKKDAPKYGKIDEKKIKALQDAGINLYK